jgi:hypothetical protein
MVVKDNHMHGKHAQAKTKGRPSLLPQPSKQTAAVK